MEMKACSAETVCCHCIWSEMQSAPVVINIVYFCASSIANADVEERREEKREDVDMWANLP